MGALKGCSNRITRQTKKILITSIPLDTRDPCN